MLSNVWIMSLGKGFKSGSILRKMHAMLLVDCQIDVMFMRCLIDSALDGKAGICGSDLAVFTKTLSYREKYCLPHGTRER